MKIKLYVDKLHNSSEYRGFLKKHDNAFMIAGFFILDFESGNNIHQIDYYIPSEKKIAAFTLDGGITMQILNTMSAAVPEKLDIKTNIDLDALQGILQDEMKNRNITEEIRKIIAIVQNINGKKIWNLNCVLSGMNILKAHVDDESKTILKMEKSSIMDYMKRIPAGALKTLQKAAKGAEAEGEEPGEEGEGAEIETKQPEGEESTKELREKIKKLSEIETEIEKQKGEAEKELEQEVSKTKPAKEKVKAKQTKGKTENQAIKPKKTKQ